MGPCTELSEFFFFSFKDAALATQEYTVNREIFVFKNLRVINFRVKKSSSASGSDKDFLTTKFF